MTLSNPSIFDFQPRTRIVFGRGAIDRLGELVRGVRRIARSCWPPIRALSPPGTCNGPKTRWPPPACASPDSTSVCENPTTEVVDACLAVARASKDRLPRRPGRRQQHGYGQGLQFPADQRRADGGLLGRRQGCAADAAADRHSHDGRHRQRVPVVRPDHAPENAREDGLRRSQGGRPRGDPRSRTDANATAARWPPATGMDAFSHALETAVTQRRNPISEMLSREAFRLCSHGLRRVFDNPSDLDARADVLLGAALAGMAIENSMFGAAHAAANPLTARYGVASRSRGRADAAGRGAVQFPGRRSGAALSPIGRARRTVGCAGRSTARPAGERIARLPSQLSEGDRPAAIAGRRGGFRRRYRGPGRRRGAAMDRHVQSAAGRTRKNLWGFIEKSCLKRKGTRADESRAVEILGPEKLSCERSVC